MKCPVCSAEMEEGFVIGGKGIFWSKDSFKLILHTKKSQGEIKLRGIFNPLGLVGYNCLKCKKIVIDYSEE